jgi:hypothetical protein
MPAVSEKIPLLGDLVNNPLQLRLTSPNGIMGSDDPNEGGGVTHALTTDADNRCRHPNGTN